MEFDYLIPAKADSRRLSRKNFRKFYGDDSLVDIQIKYLLKAGVDPFNIWLSTDSDRDGIVMKEKYAIRFILRDPELNKGSWGRTIRGMVADMDEAQTSDLPIAMFQVVNPLFNEHETFLKFAQYTLDRKMGDSVFLVQPVRQFLMTQQCNPVGWSFGEWMPCSSQLPEMLVMPWNACVMTRECIENYSYPIGGRPVHYRSNCHMVDIDYPHDWYAAQYLYARREMPEATDFTLPPLE